MNENLILYDYFRSSAAYRVRIALNLKGCKHELKTVHLLNNGGEQFSAMYQSINSLSLVPTLQDGPLIINESLAIIEYLNEKYPNPPLLPIDIATRAQVRAFALIIAADIHPICNLRVGNYLINEFKLSDTQRKQWIQHWINLGLTALEKKLNFNQHNADFCFGNLPSLADICLIPQLYSATRFECDLSAFPTLLRIADSCNQLPEFINAYPRESSLKE